jgi:hypothetical protein
MINLFSGPVNEKMERKLQKSGGKMKKPPKEDKKERENSRETEWGERQTIERKGQEKKRESKG